jgi:N-acetylglutamate synthase-like GNAT family acetyltransferase
MAEPTVREATEADLPRVLELLDQLPLSPDAEHEDLRSPVAEAYRAAYREIAASSKHRLLVVEVHGRIAGTAALIIIPNLSHRGRPWAVVENVVVDEAERGKRYGELLMQRALAIAKEAGCYKLTLTSSKARADAHRFYQRLGFRATHEGFRVDL